MALAPQAVKKAAAKVANVANCPFMRTNALSKESLSQPNVLNTASKICPFLNSALNNAQRCETCPELSFTEPAHPSSVTSSVSAISSDLNSVPKRVSNSQYDEIFTAEVSKIRSEGRYRVFADLERHAGRYPLASFRPTPSSEPKQIVSWCSNDYLSIGQNPEVIKAMVTTAQQLGTGAGGTRNIAGTSHQHVLLEARLAKLHNKPSSLLFSSCYVANETVLTTMSKILAKNPTKEKPVVFSDRHNHASMIQGIRNGVWDKVLYPHNSLSALETELKKHSISKPKVIAFESVNSMEGTIAPLSDLVYLAKKYNCLTFCDEVHAVGLYGEFGAGGSERDGIMAEIDIISGTLGKAFGVFGGYVTSNSESFVDSMRLSCPGFIFTTSLPPAVCSALNKSVEILSSKTGSQLRSKMHRNAFNLQKKLRSLRLPVMKTVSHITPVLVGDSVLCKAVSDCLIQEYGIYVQPINYPTVAKGSERLRITPLPVHDSEMMEYFVGSLDKVWAKFNLPRKDFDTEFEVDVESLSEKDFEVGGKKVYAYFENEYKQNWRRETEEEKIFERRQRNFAAAA